MLDFFVGVAHAQFRLKLPFGNTNCPIDQATGEAVCQSFNAYFTDLVNFAVIVAGLVAVLVIVYAGFMYTQSQGEAAKVSQAKELIAGALTGLILLFLTRLILPTLSIGQTIFSPISAFAQENPGDKLNLDQTNLPGPNASGLLKLDWDILLGRVTQWLVAAVAIAAFAGIIYSGYLIITAGGDPGQAAKGRSNLLWSILGLIVAMLAFVIVRFAFGLGASLT